MITSDRDRVRRFQDGEPGSFDALFSEYGDRIYRFCYRLCGHTADAEDLTQEVFLAAYQGLSRFAGRSSVATWLYRIALYRWGRIHGARRPETVPLDEETVGVAMTPDPASAGVERLSLENALLTLPDGLREAFLLVKAEGLKYREAAQVLGVPQGTVQSRVHDAVVRLRALLAEDGGERSAASDRQADVEQSGDQKGPNLHGYRCEPFQPGAEADL
jgi:RNA polymerase sigma-70 factor (ECF subfamily)